MDDELKGLLKSCSIDAALVSHIQDVKRCRTVEDLTMWPATSTDPLARASEVANKMLVGYAKAEDEIEAAQLGFAFRKAMTATERKHKRASAGVATEDLEMISKYLKHSNILKILSSRVANDSQIVRFQKELEKGAPSNFAADKLRTLAQTAKTVDPKRLKMGESV